MKRIILISLILTLTSCVSMFLNTALEKVGVFDENATITTISNNKKDIIFIGMHHIGRKEFYDDVSHKIDSLQKNDYVVFYEKLKSDKTIDSLANDIYQKKARKITGLKTFKYYDTINKKIGGEYKYKGEYELINQPKYHNLKVNMEYAINEDVKINKLIDEFELKYGEVGLNECDKKTPSNSTEFDCDFIDKELRDKFMKEFALDYRNQHLANKITHSEEKNILIIYGKNHLKGLINELQQIDPNWK